MISLYLTYFNFLTGMKLLDRNNIRPRWLKQYHDFRGDVGGTVHEQPAIHVLARTTPLGPKPLTQNQRYNSALRLTTHIASLVSLTGGEQNEHRMKNLRDLISIWESRREAVVLPKESYNENGEYS